MATESAKGMSPTATQQPVTIVSVGYGDPGLIGLLGFAFATFAAQLAHLGIQEEAPVFWIGAVFGGALQITAGLMSYRQGDNFHFLVYSAFGWYWIVSPGFLFAHEVGFLDVSAQGHGIFVLAFAFVTACFVPAGATYHSVMPVTLILVSAGLALQGISELVESDAGVKAGSIVLIGAALLAGYMLIEKFYRLTLGWSLPLGPRWLPPPSDLPARDDSV
jgi:succinate-acetate transporter protein